MVKREIRWTRRALQDKMAIMEYWFEETGDVDYSVKLETLFNSSLDIVGVNPRMGIVFSEQRCIREVVVRDYKIYYTYNDDEIVVLAIWDTRRDHNSFTI